jgi:hypothetical protein
MIMCAPDIKVTRPARYVEHTIGARPTAMVWIWIASPKGLDLKSLVSKMVVIVGAMDL